LRRLLTAAAAASLVASPIAVHAGQAARAISASDKSQGAQAHPQLMAEFGGAYRGPQVAYVTRVGQKVAVQSGLSNSASDFTVTLLDSPVENAFAIPGGYVYVTRQLLALMNSEAELASVLGHEVGHVAARHAASRNSRATIGNILAAGVGAVTGSSLATRAVGAGAQLYTLKYGRDQEYQADSLGIRYMTAAGYDPYASADILAGLAASSDLAAAAAGRSGSAVPTWASTHPNSADRVRRARQLASATGKPESNPAQDTAFIRMLDGLAYDGGTGANALPLKRIRIHTVRAGDTIDTLSRQMAYSTAQRDRFVTLNGLDPEGQLKAGTLVKLVVAS